MNTEQLINTNLSIIQIRKNIWNFGIPFWLFGITDRTIASFSDGYFSALDLMQFFTASLLFLAWLFLNPEESFANQDISYQLNRDGNLHEGSSCPAQARMRELKDYHMISQEYILPFSYLSQIYHLLNLKHLEKIHAFSLNNLKVVDVTDFQSTPIGGIIKFQTILDSPFNILRIWRQPISEVILILHNAYTVELSIPVYKNKKFIVMFNTLPLNQNEHKLFIDIYTNLEWSKPFLQILLHFAACLTLFEDLPYLRKISERDISHLVSLNKISSHKTMQLFRRFVELYGSRAENIAALPSGE